ncbi:MAG: hypothetical protein KTR20_12920, partial [Cellvibrionaceae bacterium]|nr:hypothetical protein [Cellvibrionaceae bacterium]
HSGVVEACFAKAGDYNSADLVVKHLGAVDLSLPPLLESKKAPIKARGTSLVGLNERRATLTASCSRTLSCVHAGNAEWRFFRPNPKGHGCFLV